MSIAGDQVPVIPLSDVRGNGSKTPPLQIAATWVKVGVIGFTVIVIVWLTAQVCDASGVKVYVSVAVLSIAGDQVPVIPLSDVRDNGSKTSPLQIGSTWVNIGVITWFTVILVLSEQLKSEVLK